MELLKNEKKRHKINCSQPNWDVRNIIQRGVKSFIYLECKECHAVTSISSHTADSDPNYQLVAGCMVAGVPYANIEEIYAAQGVPCMYSKTFRTYQEKVALDALEEAKKCMKETARKEAEIAIKKGDVTNGIPRIKVVTDACWSKRAMGGRNNSLGSVTTIIGYETGEILDIVVKTKVCARCEKAKKEGRLPTKHKCFQNYDRTKSSGGIEPVSVGEALCRSVETKGLIYEYIIGDGDSSVMHTIHKFDPYKEYNIKVKKN